MSYKLSGLNPLAYMGVEPNTPAQTVVFDFAPTVNDTNFNLGTLWLDTATQVPWELVSLANGTAVWIQLGATAVVPLTLTANDATKATEASNNINVVGDGTNLTTTASGSTLVILPGSTIPILFEADGSTSTTAISNTIIFSGGANVTTTADPSTGTITIAAESGAAGASTFITDSGNATETGGNISILGDGTNIITSATGVGTHEVTVTFGGITQYSLAVGTSTTNVASLGVATNGQLPIGSTGADPVLSTITAGTGITVGNAAGSITISATGGGGGSSTFTAFGVGGATTWTAQPTSNMVTVIGWGGGGGGGSGGIGATGGSGGGGGAPTSCFYWTGPAAFFGSAAVSLSVGAGGAGGAAQTSSSTAGNNGVAGTRSTFGNITPPPIAYGQNYGAGGGAAQQGALGGIAGYIYSQDNNYSPTIFSPTAFPSTLFNTAVSQVQLLSSRGQTADVTSYDVAGGFGGFNSSATNTLGGPANNIGGAVSALQSGVSVWTYRYITPTGGGGGGSGSTTAGRPLAGGTGGSVRALDNTSTLKAGGTAGASGGGNAGNGNNTINTDGSSLIGGGIMYGGTGGGGGGGDTGATGGGNGGSGGFPGGAGGGGGGAVNGNDSGAGGDGADGLILVIEW